MVAAITGLITACSEEQITAPVDQSARSRFIALWQNDDPETRGITRVIIAGHGDSFHVEMFGKCHPQNCYWGKTSTPLADTLDDTLSLFWDQGFCVRNQTLVIRPDARLRVWQHTHFTDGSGRSDYDAEYLFTRED
jgi:hypothetical protein